MTDPALLQDAYQFREFLRSPAHHALTKHLDFALADTLERVLDPGAETPSILYHRGVYEGLKRARTLPEQIMQRAGVS